MRPEPVAQIVFAFSAVEMIGQSESWTGDQGGYPFEASTKSRNLQTTNQACCEVRFERIPSFLGRGGYERMANENVTSHGNCELLAGLTGRMQPTAMSLFIL